MGSASDVGRCEFGSVRAKSAELRVGLSNVVCHHSNSSPTCLHNGHLSELYNEQPGGYQKRVLSVPNVGQYRS